MCYCKLAITGSNTNRTECIVWMYLENELITVVTGGSCFESLVQLLRAMIPINRSTIIHTSLFCSIPKVYALN
ncbi:hypothetical protein QQG55_49485 [Brugia pahangi]